MNDATDPLTARAGEEAAGGVRLDKWLAETFPDLSRSRLKALIEDGRVTIDGLTIAEPSAKIKPGHAVSLEVPAPIAALPAAQAIPLTVVFEDAHLIVIDKPAGLVVHPAPGSPDTTLVNALLNHCTESLSGIGGVRRPGIVHRLDKDTSGLIVAAKTDAAHHGLARQFAEHTVERAYWAVVWGVPRPPKGEVEGNIGRSPADRKKMAIVNHGGKRALTRYQTLKVFGDAASLVECRLATGRTHQIRVHMASLGHPLVGDQTYGRGRRARASRIDPLAAAAVTSFPRQALHAFLLGFIHPETGERLRFESDMPNDIKSLRLLLESL
ncbi:MAG: RluA family pseudouridine synthase [Alphaproteobacteria bacterium]|nr:RluA family pseudouridine synthase [Alphaproteobacteria bacterium]